jgi:hypothetical protein
VEQRRVDYQMWTLIKHQHNVSSHFIMVSLDSSKISWYPLSGHNTLNLFNEFHYILFNHFNLLEYIYIIVPSLNEFCELHIFMWKGVQEFFTQGCCCPFPWYLYVSFTLENKGAYPRGGLWVSKLLATTWR